MAGRTTQLSRQELLPVESALWAGLTALADPVRLRIVLLLREREQCVCHLTEDLGLSQGTISHHMRVLKRAGLVQDRRDTQDARWVYYRLDPAGLSTLGQALGRILDASGMDITPADCRGRGEGCRTDSKGEV